MATPKTGKSKIYAYAASIILVICITLIGELVKKSLEPANIVMLYLLAVVIVAIKWGQGPAVMTSILSVLFFDFFLIPPYLTFGVDRLQYIFTFVGLMVVGIVISTLASRTRQAIIQRQMEELHTALLNSVSHDLRTPLVSVTGAITTIINKGSVMSEASRRELLETAYEEANRLNNLVGNLLDMAKMEAGSLQICRNPCDLRDLVGASLEESNKIITGRTVKIDIPVHFPEIPVDFSLMMKVFTNLIGNAVKYSPSSSIISITAAVLQDKAKIEIKDAGCGIPKDDIKRIFEKFYRGGNVRHVTGSGLGLSICKGIIEAHSGRIEARNNSDAGATFTIFLPLK